MVPTLEKNPVVETDRLPPLGPGSFQNIVSRDAPALDIDKLISTMDAFDDYVDSCLCAYDAFEGAPSIWDDA